MKKSILLIALIALMAILLVACSNTTTVVDEDGNTITVDENNNEATVTFTDDEGNTATMQSGTGLDLPADWPKNEMPIYPGSIIVYIADSEAGSTIAIGTNDDLAQLADYYSDKLANATNSMNFATEDGGMLTGTIDNITYMIIVGNDQEDSWGTEEDFTAFAVITATPMIE